MGASAQLRELNIPDPLLVKLTDPVGATGARGPISVTVAVHVVATFTGTVPGLQLTTVEVGLGNDTSTRRTCAFQVRQSPKLLMDAVSEKEPVETGTVYVLVS